MSATRSISLPEELCKKAENRFGARFGTLEEFLTATMTELLHDEAAVMDEREQKIIEERLKNLGYI